MVLNSAPTLPADTLSCTDFSHPELCTVDSSLILGTTVSTTICNTFSETPQVGFIAQSWINIYNDLRNMYFAVLDAHNQLVNEGYIDKMVADVSPKPLPIPRSILLKLVDISLDFIPAPVGPELAAFKTVVKTFKKLAGKAISSAEDDAQQQEQNLADQPQILKGLLDSVLPTQQAAIMDQIQDVFVNAATDDSAVQLLLGGVHLQPVPSQSDYTAAIAHNLRAYLLSQFMAKTGVTLLVDNIVESCNALDVNDGNGKCRRLVLSEGAGTPITAATSDKPANLPDLQASFGININDVIDNALDCNGAGKDFGSVDFTAFLDPANTSVFPQCLFGIPVITQNF